MKIKTKLRLQDKDFKTMTKKEKKQLCKDWREGRGGYLYGCRIIISNNNDKMSKQARNHIDREIYKKLNGEL